jgi:hypothetical protein
MMQIFKSSRSLFSGVVFVCACVLAPTAARASEEFPGAIQEAAGMPCAPQCALCHGVTPGTAGTFMNKKLGATLFNIEGNGVVLPHDVAKLKSAYAIYAAKPENMAAVVDLKAGVDPQTKDSLCGPTYGCGARVAKKAPSRDLSAPLWIAVAMTLGVLFRRRNKIAS